MTFTDIPAQSGRGFRLERGRRLRVKAPTGGQVADLFCFSEERPLDALSSGRSIDYNDTLRFTSGHVLYSNSGVPMLEIVEDTCGRHDFLVTPCSEQMFRMINEDEGSYRSCQQNLWDAFREFDRPPELVTTTFNIFMNFRHEPSGRIGLEAPINSPEDVITFLALESLVVGLTACSDPGTNGGRCKPVSYSIV